MIYHKYTVNKGRETHMDSKVHQVNIQELELQAENCRAFITHCCKDIRTAYEHLQKTEEQINKVKSEDHMRKNITGEYDD